MADKELYDENKQTLCGYYGQNSLKLNFIKCKQYITKHIYYTTTDKHFEYNL